jgi:TolB-like protein/class 3 adenylate cyclase
MERKLAAIFSADVQGYSRLMGDDEEATVQTLTEYRGMMTSFIQQHRGRVVDSPGDNLLADFASIVDTVQCGVVIQQELKTQNEALPEHRRMRFRIGINLGDVLVEGERIYGDGVNIAARMEGLAEGGGICLSGTAYDQVKNKLALKYEYLGEREVKNIADPVRVYRVVVEDRVEDQAKTEQVTESGESRDGKKGSSVRDLTKVERSLVGKGRRTGLMVAIGVILLMVVGVMVWQGMQKLRPSRVEETVSPSKHRIAVLPFVNMSGDPENEYFSDGITEELITQLSKISGLEVIAQTSIMKYKGVKKDVGEIGQELRVETVLEGSVRRAADKVRITTQLINTQNQAHLWVQSYDRELKDIFAIQSDVAQKVAEALKVQLMAGEKQRIKKKETENLEAYNLYLAGLYNWNKQTKEELEKAVEYFKQEIEKDPSYAQAYAKLALTYDSLAWGGFLSKKEGFSKAKEAALKALGLDDTNVDALVVLGDIKDLEWDWSGAQSAHERALSLNPNSSYVHQAYSIQYLLPMGQYEEAIAEVKRAIELDPLSIASQTNFAWVLYLAGQYDLAIEQFHRAIEMEPGIGDNYRGLGEIYATKGMYEKSIVTLQKAVDVSGGTPYSLASLGWAYGVAGKREEALKILEMLKEKAKQEPVDASDFTRVYPGLGDNDQAITWLQKAYEDGYDSWILIWAKQFPSFDPIRSDPRFIELLRKVGLEK